MSEASHEAAAARNVLRIPASKSLLVLLVLFCAIAGTADLLGYSTRPIFWFSIALAACLVATRQDVVSNRLLSVLDSFSTFLFERGAFRSDPLAEAPKFALIRLLFGLFMTQRAIWILVYLSSTDPFVIWLIAWLNLLAALAVTVGLGTQVALLYLVFFQWHVGDVVLGTSTLGNDIAAMLSLLLLFANAGAHFSLDRVLMKRGGRVGRLASLFYFDYGIPSRNTLQIAKFLTLFAYWCVCLYSLSQHLNEPAWMTGTAGPLLLSNNFMSAFSDEFAAFFAQGWWAVMLGRIALWAMLPWYALIIPFVILGGIFRSYVIFWGVLFFALSLFVLGLGWLAHFEFLMLAALFWERRFITGPKTLCVAYDDRCNLCDRTVQFVKAVDLFSRVELRPVSKNIEWLKSLNIAPQDALTDLYGIEVAKGDCPTKGYDFYLLLTKHVLLLTPLYPLLVIGKVAGGRAVYRFIADRRTRIFGVCNLPSPKAEYRLLPAGASAPVTIGKTDPIAPVSLHLMLLAAFYLVSTPAPYLGWSGKTFPHMAAAAHYYGITPINVFNNTDLHMAENWFTISILGEDGEQTLLPIFTEDGKRLAMHSSDRVYFGTTVKYRRGTIGKTGCFFNDYKDKLVYLASAYGAPDGRQYVYAQYFRPLPDPLDILSGSFVRSETEKVCSVTFGSTPLTTTVSH